MSGTIKASEESDYFDRQLCPDAPGNNQRPGVWFGKLAKKLGLSGQCFHDEFHLVAKGCRPTNGEYLRPRKAEVAWYEFVASVPLSVSGTALTAPLIRKLLWETVEQQVDFIERFALIRDQRTRATCPKSRSDGLVIAVFFERASRAAEPNLHVHFVIFNLTCNGSEWRALSAHELYRVQSLLDHAFLAKLAGKLVETGFSVTRRPDGYAFEIDGVPLSVFEKFGSRRRDILAAMPSNEVSGSARRKLTNKLAIETRKSKDPMTESIVDALAWASLSAVEQEALKLVAARAAQRSQMVRVARPLLCVESAFAAAAQRVFAQGWVARDVDLVVGAISEHWGEPIEASTWMTAQSTAGLVALGPKGYFVAPAEKMALDQLPALRLPSVQFRVDDSRAILGLQAATKGLDVVVIAPSGDSKLGQCLGWRVWPEKRPPPEGPETGRSVAVLEISDPLAWAPSAVRRMISTNWRAVVVAFIGDTESEAQRVAAKTLQDATQPVSINAFPVAARGRRYSCSLGQGSTVELLEHSIRALWREVIADHVAAQFAAGKPRYVADPVGAVRGLEEAIRAELFARGVLSGPIQPAFQLQPVKFDADQFQKNPKQFITAGSVLEFQQNVPGHLRGTRVRVDCWSHGKLIVWDARERESALTVPRLDDIEVFVESDLSLMLGEHIRLTKPRKGIAGPRLQTDRAYRITKITAEGAIMLSNGAILPTDYGHLRYAYVLPRDSLGRESESLLVVDGDPDAPIDFPQTFLAPKKRTLVLTGSADRFAQRFQGVLNPLNRSLVEALADSMLPKVHAMRPEAPIKISDHVPLIPSPQVYTKPTRRDCPMPDMDLL